MKQNRPPPALGAHLFVFCAASALFSATSQADAGGTCQHGPPRDVQRKVPASVRLDPQALEWLRSRGEAHLTRINDI
jgi:uncharacterized protein (DUF4415 family)